MRIEQTPEFKRLKSMGACLSSREWILSMNSGSPQKLWKMCDRADWMLWLIYKRAYVIHQLRQKLVKCFCSIIEEDGYELPDEEKEKFQQLKNWKRGRMISFNSYLDNVCQITRGFPPSMNLYNLCDETFCIIFRKHFPKVSELLGAS